MAKHNFAASILVAFVITLFYFVLFKNTIFSLEKNKESGLFRLFFY